MCVWHGACVCLMSRWPGHRPSRRRPTHTHMYITLYRWGHTPTHTNTHTHAQWARALRGIDNCITDKSVAAERSQTHTHAHITHTHTHARAQTGPSSIFWILSRPNSWQTDGAISLSFFLLATYENLAQPTQQLDLMCITYCACWIEAYMGCLLIKKDKISFIPCE